MTRILLVEDDQSLGATLKERLEKEKYEVVLARTSAAALAESAKQGFDLHILDVGLPDGTGFELARRLPGKPLIFLTAQGDAESRLLGYDLGAEEYIPKPFHLRELLMRIRHVLDNHMPSSLLEIGDVRVNFDGFTFEKSGRAEVLPAKDLALLKLLVDQSPKVVSRDEALNLLWGEDKFPSNRTVDNSILRLRTALGDVSVCIESVRGVGYQFCRVAVRRRPSHEVVLCTHAALVPGDRAGHQRRRAAGVGKSPGGDGRGRAAHVSARLHAVGQSAGGV
ncbi:MAG: response regulator transcription factor [Calothrix sp. SM1_5_4]|nr:response regulator transcription factor [Calothrix sp. SM1_5_4]